MRNTKQKASIQSMNKDNLNPQANNEGKGNTPGCRRKNNNELYGKSITIENPLPHSRPPQQEAQTHRYAHPRPLTLGRRQNQRVQDGKNK